MSGYGFRIDRGEQPAGPVDLPFLNAPSDVPTTYADFVGNINYNESIVKLAFSEQTTDKDGQLSVRYVHSIALNKATLGMVHEIIGNMIAAMNEQGKPQA